LGLFLAWGASYMVGQLFDFSLLFVVSPALITWTLAGSFGLGAFAGIWPAWRASKLPVVDALRYE
jgi:ABC-type antimicrobial peptide transport system permease subunit